MVQHNDSLPRLSTMDVASVWGGNLDRSFSYQSQNRESEIFYTDKNDFNQLWNPFEWNWS